MLRAAMVTERLTYRRVYFLEDPLQLEGLSFATHDRWLWLPDVGYDGEKSEVLFYLSGDRRREGYCYELRIRNAGRPAIKQQQEGEENCDIYEWRKIPGANTLELVSHFDVRILIPLFDDPVAMLTWPVDPPIPKSLLGWLGSALW